MSSAKKKPVTAVELMARLQSDPDWVRRNAEREQKRATAVAELRAELKPEQDPLLAELATVGWSVTSVWDLVNTKEKYPAAIPVLAKYLRIARHPVLREGIARALTVAEARGAPAREILAELRRRAEEPKNEARWALANALTAAGDANMMEEVEAMIADPRFQDLHAILKLVLKKIAAR